MPKTAGSILETTGIPRVDAKEIEDLPKKSDEPLLVAFVAEWCEVSRDEAPILAAVAKRFEGRVRFAFADVDRRATDAARLSVRSVPAVIIFAKERELERHVGAATEDVLADLIDTALEEYAKIDETKEPEPDTDDAKADDDKAPEADSESA
jgi:thioredoxin 1